MPPAAEPRRRSTEGRASTIVLWRRLIAQFLGSAFLAAVVIGSGIAAQNLSPGTIGRQLFENAAATGAGLFAIILMFGPISGGHFNPIVSFVDAAFGDSGGVRPRRICRSRPSGAFVGRSWPT
jgi:glycerol uptake facilitator-like aquaporin